MSRVPKLIHYRLRYGHSPASWTKLWKRVFAEVVSQDFADKHVRIDAELTTGFRGKVLGAKLQAYMLVWSVRIV